MGLIRSGQTDLTPLSETAELTAYLWPIVREIIKTAIENKQHLIVEGIYIPFHWAEDFAPEYRKEIRYECLIMSVRYIRTHFADIQHYACVVEERLDDSDCTMESVLQENAEMLAQAKRHNLPYRWSDEKYEIEESSLFAMV